MPNTVLQRCAFRGVRWKPSFGFLPLPDRDGRAQGPVGHREPLWRAPPRSPRPSRSPLGWAGISLSGQRLQKLRRFSHGPTRAAHPHV